MVNLVIYQESLTVFIRFFQMLAMILITSKAYAVVDKEMVQSAKCVGYFRHFENRLKIPRDTLYSISLQETGKIHYDKKVKIAWPWTVNVEGKGYYFNTKQEAMIFVRDRMLEGKESIDVGCMQVNLKHHPDAFHSLDQAFDPRSNIAYGAKFLVSKFEQLGSWTKAIAHYHSATPHLGEKYKNSVVKIAQNIDHYKSVFKKLPGARPIKLIALPEMKAQSRKYVGAIGSKTPITNKDKKYRSNMMVYINKKKGA
jgi:soluble lytic murein transglycosylase-like protein